MSASFFLNTTQLISWASAEHPSVCQQNILCFFISSCVLCFAEASRLGVEPSDFLSRKPVKHELDLLPPRRRCDLTQSAADPPSCIIPRRWHLTPWSCTLEWEPELPLRASAALATTPTPHKLLPLPYNLKSVQLTGRSSLRIAGRCELISVKSTSHDASAGLQISLHV